MNSIYFSNILSLGTATVSLPDDINKAIADLRNIDLKRNSANSKDYLDIVVSSENEPYNIEELANQVHLYEGKYGLESHKFYDLYTNNYLKTTNDFVDWAILYKNLFLKSNATR